MTRSISDHFDGKVIVPNEPVDLPKGQTLRITVELDGESPSAFAELGDLCVAAPEIPDDLSEQVDHYVYGTPKR